MSYNKLLLRQIKKFLPDNLKQLPEIQHLLDVVNDSYNAYERDKELYERAFSISEEEYIDINKKLTHEVEVRKLSVEKLKEVVGAITGEDTRNNTDDLLVIARYLNMEINKRKNAEKVFTSLISNMQSGILLEDDTRHIVFANQLFCDLFAIPIASELLQGADCSDSAEQNKHLFKNPAKFVSNIGNILDKKELITGEILEMADGRFLERDYIPIFLDKKYQGHLWKYTDITEKYLAQDAIAKSELNNRLILNAGLDAIIIINDKAEITFWNPQAEKIFGWKESEVLNKLLSNTIIPARHKQAHDAGMEHYLKTGEGPILNKIIELVAITKDNEEVPVELSITPIKRDDGILFCSFIRDISARKKAEHDLKASQEIWQFALEGAGDGVWEYDFETKEVFFSKQYKRMLGYEESEFENKPEEWLSRIHPDDICIVEETDRQYFENKINSHQREYRIKHKNGNYLWILDRGMIINYTDNGKPQRIIGTHTDITGRKEEEDEYRRISVVASANENGVVFTDANGLITWSNEGFCRITGYSMEEAVGKTPLDLCKGILSEGEELKKMVNAFMEGKNFNVELIHYRKNGTCFWGKVTGQAIINERNKATEYFAIIEDISYQKEVDEALRIREEKYRSIIANMKLGLMEVDTEEKILFVNQSFCDMSGYSETDLLGHKASMLFVRGENHELMEVKNDMRKNGVSDAYEISIKNKRGEPKWWLISGAPRFNDNGELIGSIGIHLDITEQKRTEYELYEAREQAETSVNAKQEFLANMSHEIRTPMNAIMGMSSQLKKTSLNTQQQFYLDTIHNAAENLLVIINDILDLSKIEAGKLSLENIGFDTKSVIRKALQVFVHKVEEKGLRLTNSEFDPAVAQVLIGDPYRLNQVLMNLLSNATKFTEKGSIDIAVRVANDTANAQTIFIQVKDTGIGMDDKFLNQLFDKFSQEYQLTTRKYGGTGLGMSICRELVALMGGDIEVESKKGEGTTVTIKLTCKKGTVSDIPARDTTIADTKILEGKRILVTDDNDMNRLVAATVLNNYGATIIEAANGQEAVDILSTEEVDLVLMDIQMPVLDGLEATQIIRNQLHSKIPVIALTANAIRGENEKCLNAGMNDYISKPFKEEDFVSTIARWLGKEITMISAAEQNNTGSPLFKLDQLYNISRGNDAFVKKMIDLFIQQTPVAVQDIKEAYTVNDFTKVKALAHKMKPSIDNLEISLLTSDIRLIESLVLQGKRSDELDILINKLEEVIDKVVSEIKLI
jgi:PAS domain S-box-containing protein